MEYPVRIIARGRFSREQIDVETVVLDPLPQEVAERVEERWAAELARNPRLTSGPLLVAQDVSLIDDGARLRLRCGLSNYKNFMGTTHESIAPYIDSRYWHRAIGMLSVTVTSDDYLVLGVRSPTIDWGLLRHVVPAGRLRPAEKDPFNGIIAEYQEELGIGVSDIRHLECLGVVADETWGRLNYEFVFRAEVALTAAQVFRCARNAKSAGEHCQLEAFPDTQEYVEWLLKSDPNGFVPTGLGGLWLASIWRTFKPFWKPAHRTYEEHMGRRLDMLKR